MSNALPCVPLITEYLSSIPLASRKIGVMVICVCVCVHVHVCARVHTHSLFSFVSLFATSWMVAYQSPLFMGISGQEYWSGLPFPIPEGLPDPGMETKSLAYPELAGRFFTTVPPGKPNGTVNFYKTLCYSTNMQRT